MRADDPTPSKVRSRSLICSGPGHEYCTWSSCHCACHFEMVDRKEEFTSFQYECWAEKLTERVADEDEFLEVAMPYVERFYPAASYEQLERLARGTYELIDRKDWSMSAAKEANEVALAE